MILDELPDHHLPHHRQDVRILVVPQGFGPGHQHPLSNHLLQQGTTLLDGLVLSGQLASSFRHRRLEFPESDRLITDRGENLRLPPSQALLEVPRSLLGDGGSDR